MTQVIGQRMIYGSGIDLHYEMGDPVTFKGDLLNVTIDFGGLVGPAYYDEPTNSVNVINDRLNKTDIGTWDLVIEAVYREQNGTIIEYTSEMYLQVIDPDARRTRIPQVAPDIPDEIDKNVWTPPAKRYDEIP